MRPSTERASAASSEDSGRAGKNTLVKRPIIMVLGATGFLGRHLVTALGVAGAKVVRLVKSSQALPSPDVVDQHISRIDPIEISKLIRYYGATHFLHLASGLVPGSDEVQYGIEQQQVVTPTIELLPHLASEGVQIIYFSSGGALYAGLGTSLRRETDLCKPISFYGRCKLQIEEQIIQASHHIGLRYLIIRPSNPFGFHQRRDGRQGFIAATLGRLLRGESCEIWGDGLVVRDYLYIDDLCRGMNALLTQQVGQGVFNISSGVGHNLLEVVAVISKVSGKKIEPIFRPGRPVDMPHQVLSRGLIAQYDPLPVKTLDEGIADYARLLGLA